MAPVSSVSFPAMTPVPTNSIPCTTSISCTTVTISPTTSIPTTFQRVASREVNNPVLTTSFSLPLNVVHALPRGPIQGPPQPPQPPTLNARSPAIHSDAFHGFNSEAGFEAYCVAHPHGLNHYDSTCLNACQENAQLSFCWVFYDKRRSTEHPGHHYGSPNTAPPEIDADIIKPVSKVEIDIYKYCLDHPFRVSPHDATCRLACAEHPEMFFCEDFDPIEKLALADIDDIAHSPDTTDLVPANTPEANGKREMDFFEYCLLDHPLGDERYYRDTLCRIACAEKPDMIVCQIYDVSDAARNDTSTATAANDTNTVLHGEGNVEGREMDTSRIWKYCVNGNNGLEPHDTACREACEKHPEVLLCQQNYPVGSSHSLVEALDVEGDVDGDMDGDVDRQVDVEVKKRDLHHPYKCKGVLDCLKEVTDERMGWMEMNW